MSPLINPGRFTDLVDGLTLSVNWACPDLVDGLALSVTS